VNPQWVRLLNLLEMNVRYGHCRGAELVDSDGRRYLDFLSGYCVHNIGHNHPAVVEALKNELDRSGPAMLQSHVTELAGELAARLCALAGGGLKKVFFSSSGSEGIEAAIKFARAHTGRSRLIHAEGAFHGLTCGALSLMGNPFWRAGFEPLLPGVEQVAFDNLAELERKLSTRLFAAFVIEPIQAEGGIRIPTPEYLQGAQSLCRRYGTLFVADEVQTGMCRTGPFLASHHFGIEPDIVILAKALSGGLVPSGAVLMKQDIYDSVYGTLHRAIIHTSTFSENSLAMRAGLATLDVLDKERLGERATEAGEDLRDRLRQELSDFEMFEEVRGLGLLCGIAFKSPRKLSLKIPFEAFHRIHPAMFGQVLVMRLFRDAGILTQTCGNNFMVLKVAPPLVLNARQAEDFVMGISDVVEMMHSSSAFWSDALRLARRVVRV
jgi:ornithine--oxo-acid transaminase